MTVCFFNFRDRPCCQSGRYPEHDSAAASVALAEGVSTSGERQLFLLIKIMVLLYCPTTVGTCTGSQVLMTHAQSWDYRNQVSFATESSRAAESQLLPCRALGGTGFSPVAAVSSELTGKLFELT